MITNQNNYPDKNHKSAAVASAAVVTAMIKSPLRKTTRPVQLQAAPTSSQPLQKYPLVSIREYEGDSREHREQVRQSNVQYKQSRIPTTTMATATTSTTTTRNFNQISQAPTNLWHGIYEKHLLNQTKFERIADDKWANKCASNGRKNRESGVGNTQPSETNFNNNLCQNELRMVASMSPLPLLRPESHTQFALMRRHIDPQSTIAGEPCMAKKSVKFRLTNRSPIPSTAEHQHFHKQINFFDANGCASSTAKMLPEQINKSAANDLHHGLTTTTTTAATATNVCMQAAEQRHHRPYAYSSETQIPSEMGFVYVQPGVIEKNKVFCPPPLNGHSKQIKSEINDADCQLYRNTGGVGARNQPYNRISGNICLERGQRGQPVGGSHNHREDCSSAPAIAGTTAKTASLSVVSGVNAKVACNTTFVNAITTALSASGDGESTPATNSEYTSNRINIMLETAQAMAAAAYFARLVVLTQ